MTTTSRQPATPPEAGPEPLLRLATVGCQARALESALDLEVFAALADGPADAAETCARTGLHPRPAGDFLDALVALGLLTGGDGWYANAPAAARMLRPDAPDHVGDFARQIGRTYNTAFRGLTIALRTGGIEAQQRGGFAAKSHHDRDGIDRFMAVMDGLSSRIGVELAARVDWSRYATFADLGGARGHLCAMLARAHPHLRGVCFDRPDAGPYFAAHADQLGVADRVGFQGGDLLADPIPEADVLILGQVLHGFGEPDRVELVERAARALRPGGTLLVYDRMLDDGRRDPQRLMFSLYMRLVSPAGSEYRAVDCQGWLRRVGCHTTWTEPLLDTHTLVGGER